MDRCCKYALFKLYWGLLNNLTYFTCTCYTHEPIEGCTENVNSMNNFRAKYSYLKDFMAIFPLVKFTAITPMKVTRDCTCRGHLGRGETRQIEMILSV